MTLIQKIRTSFTTQLSLWVSGFVLVISVLVIILLAVFSQDAIRDESIDTTMQTLENAALRIDNTLRQTEMTARLEKQQMHVDRLRIETLIEENSYLEKIQQALPHARLYVTRRDSSRFDTYIIGSMAGYHELTYEDEDVYVFSQPIGGRDYCLAAVCPADDIYGRYARITLGAAVVVRSRHTPPAHRALLGRCLPSTPAAQPGRLSTGYCTRQTGNTDCRHTPSV